jgi:hypothetical protein
VSAGTQAHRLGGAAAVLRAAARWRQAELDEALTEARRAATALSVAAAARARQLGQLADQRQVHN